VKKSALFLSAYSPDFKPLPAAVCEIVSPFEKTRLCGGSFDHFCLNCLWFWERPAVDGIGKGLEFLVEVWSWFEAIGDVDLL
jgi:hypothetical protein